MQNSPYFSDDRQAVVVEVSGGGRMTIPLERWPLEAEGLGFGSYKDGVFVPDEPQPPPVVFEPLSRAELRFALLSANVTGAMIEKAIDAIPDTVARETARIAWEDSSRYDRDHPLVAQIGAGFGMGAEVIDALWLKAQSKK